MEWTSDAPGVTAARHLGAFRSLVLAHWAVQAWAWRIHPLPTPATFPPVAIAAVASLLSLCLLLSFGRHARQACWLALPLSAWCVVWLFPMTPNHTFLALVILGLLALLDPGRPDEEALLIQALRWLAVIVFFYAGLQKALHGLYFRGEFLAWMIGQGSPQWGEIFGWMMPADEIARLRSYPRFAVGGGPYRVDSLPFLVVANGVWVGEMALAGLLVWRRSREWAALAAIGLVFAIQLSPREFMFALLYTQLLLLSVRGEWNRRLLPLFLLAYGWLLAALLGAPGGGWILKASGDL